MTNKKSKVKPVLRSVSHPAFNLSKMNESSFLLFLYEKRLSLEIYLYRKTIMLGIGLYLTWKKGPDCALKTVFSSDNWKIKNWEKGYCLNIKKWILFIWAAFLFLPWFAKNDWGSESLNHLVVKNPINSLVLNIW